ncbi:hypothetical protein GUJ93_ZPchr0007g6394 [Zizania palustris]|uniref:Uncharacterized protein n=1 Tax=Zizania palustris TaxID=103762 RepID=A0A8J5T4Q5_ZIZPA|nr:hypothetical protein GUJ93_ZPchr0007g6394 [Zizania palustris]
MNLKALSSISLKLPIPNPYLAYMPLSASNTIYSGLPVLHNLLRAYDYLPPHPPTRRTLQALHVPRHRSPTASRRLRRAVGASPPSPPSDLRSSTSPALRFWRFTVPIAPRCIAGVAPPRCQTCTAPRLVAGPRRRVTGPPPKPHGLRRLALAARASLSEPRRQHLKPSHPRVARCAPSDLFRVPVAAI